MQGRPLQTKAGSIDFYLGGVFQSSSYADADQTYFQVVNGSVNGDHKSPNPIQFYRYTSVVDPFAYSRTDSGFPTQSWSGRCKSEQSTQTVGLFDPSDSFDAFPVSYPNLMEEAIGKIFEEFRGNNEVLVDAAEGAATVRMFKSTAALHKGVAGILETIVHSVDKRGRSRGQVSLDYITSKWLEYRYGWMPLVLSVYDALENLHREQLATVREITGKAKSLRKDSYHGQSLSFSGSQGVINLPLQRIMEDSRRVRVSMRFKAPEPGIQDWTSLNPSSIAWELLPMSFVADWFVTIGDSLRALENYLLWKTNFIDGYVTHTYKGIRYGKIAGQGTAGLISPVVTISKLCSEYREVVAKNRVVLTSLPVPIGPRFKVDLNGKRMLDSVSMFNLMVSSKLRKVLPPSEFKRTGLSTRGRVRRALGQIADNI